MVFDRNAVASSSPRLPPRLPWEELRMIINRNAVASWDQFNSTGSATALRLQDQFSFSQGSRSGNPGLEGATASRLSTKHQRGANETHVRSY